MDEPEASGMERGADLNRTVNFSDAVFAIAITILALDLRLPGTEAEDLPGALLDLWPALFGFLISFWLIGIYWMAHHRIFHYIIAYDRGLLRINLFFLMWIVLLPFSSSLIGDYGDRQLAAIIYAAHVSIAGLSLAWLRRHASRDPRLMDTRSVDARELRYHDLRGLAVPLVFILSIGVSFISVTAAELFWLLAFFVRPVLMKFTHRSTA